MMTMLSSMFLKASCEIQW